MPSHLHVENHIVSHMRVLRRMTDYYQLQVMGRIDRNHIVPSKIVPLLVKLVAREGIIGIHLDSLFASGRLSG